MTLIDDDLVRYARHIVLKEIGGEGQKRLMAARVAVIGAGGIGSPAIQYLAAAGVGRLTLIDDDRVDLSNLQRQTIFATTDIGMPKVAAAAAAARALNPRVAVDTHPVRLEAANVAMLLAGADVVLDGCDNFATRLIVADQTLRDRVPLVSAAVGQFDGQLGVFRGWEPDRPCYRCFVGTSPDREAGSCAEDGILGPVAGVFGSLAALEAIRAIVSFGEDSAGKLLVADTLSLRFRTIALPKDPGCRWCGDQRPV
ncbi:HesA/MoeB/ThiF family protein [Sphingomonas oligophenolica]|uniref:Molybdopterin-synthase adenylyltransferase n=1 Tax=Sphingomonas oligophenolica TaxID=301154 RepID=A0A502CJM3_9SPHN|nr:molybdopterin-synthase adenylyltransferase MoeB [Sphingomonas oligophenolica]TPG12844.1 molybdopterin-synthase adenylyltransferase MoeB [Sphingomonas oligophenolica]